MSNTYNIYCGVGDAANIDWSTPVATVGGEKPSLKLALEAGRIYVLGVRRVSAGGVEEQGSDTLAYVRVDDEGALAPLLLPPAAVTLRPMRGSQASISFRYELPPGLKPPEAFEILSDHGSGLFDLDEPVLTIRPAVEARRQSQFCCSLQLETPLERFRVRARVGGHFGPVSAPARLKAPSPAPVAIEEVSS